MVLLSNSNWGDADPAINYTLGEWQLLLITNDGLVQYRRVGGAAGTQIVPDLAVALPKVTDDGKTYTFKLRTGIRYSNGALLEPSDFITVMKRQFVLPGPANGFYADIVGATACIAHPASCDLSQGIVADNATRALTFHLVSPDPEFLDQLTLPFAFAVPGNTPMKDLGNNPPPGTGPYKWSYYKPNSGALLVRNPYFHQWSAPAQPAGYPSQIEYKFGLSAEDETTEIENGQADWMLDQPPADRLNEIGTKYAAQTHINPLTADFYMAMNVNIPPFNNLKARQAVNYAVNRSTYVKLAGGPSLAQPTCQVLPPAFPGYSQYCPYTANPAAGGHGPWTAPDLAKARQLVAASGTKGANVAVIGLTDGAGKAVTEQFVADLNSLGYHATAKLLAHGVEYPYIQNSNNHVQVAFTDWYQDYPAASDFLNVLLGCGSFHPGSSASPNISGFCDHQIQSQMNHAATLGVTNPTAANTAWAGVDRAATDQAPWVDLYNPKLVDFVSARVHGYQWSPQWYFLMDQAWIK